jgi:LPXTG-motif cell wall-anchored protein
VAPEIDRSKIRRTSLKFHLIFQKTFMDMLKPIRTVIYLFIAAIIPLVIGTFLFQNIGSFPVQAQVDRLGDVFILMTYVWLAGIPFAMFVPFAVSSLISREMKDGTMISLISRPIRRWEIVAGKFLGFLAYAMIVQTFVFVISAYLLVTLTGANLGVFPLMFKYLPMFLAYSFIVALFMGGLSIFFSTVIKWPILSTFLVIVLVLIWFFVFLLIRLIVPETYSSFYLYYIDIGYYFGNTLYLLIGIFGIDMSPFLQIGMSVTTGVFDIRAVLGMTDPDQGFDIANLPETGYMSPVGSLFGLLLMSGAFLFLSIYRMYRKEFN